MNVIDNAVLTAMFVSQFDGSDPVAAVRARCRLDEGYVRGPHKRPHLQRAGGL